MMVNPCTCIITCLDLVTGFKMPGAAYDLGCETHDHSSRNFTGHGYTRQTSSHRPCPSTGEGSWGHYTLDSYKISIHSARTAKSPPSSEKLPQPIQPEDPERDHEPATQYKTGELEAVGRFDPVSQDREC